jgi:hypothetical protein
LFLGLTDIISSPKNITTEGGKQRKMKKIDELSSVNKLLLTIKIYTTGTFTAGRRNLQKWD